MLTDQRTIFQKESVEALRDQLNIDYDCSKARKSCRTRRTKNPSLVHWVPCEFYFDAFRMCSLVVIVGFCYLNIIRRDYL